MKLRDYVIRRLILSIVVLLGVSAVTFAIARIVPSNPARLWLGPHPTREQIARVEEEFGLNQPLHIQYIRYMSNLLTGNLGVSLRTHRPVLEDIKAFLPASLELICLGMIIGLIGGLILGVISSTRRDQSIDHFGRIFSITGVSLPSFWMGMMAQLVFFKWLGLLPVGGRIDDIVSLTHPIQWITGSYLLDSLLTGNWVAFTSVAYHIILPALVLAAYPFGLVARMTRSSMVEILQEDYIKTARAYGLRERTITYIYALKNSLGPTITVSALTFAYALVETFLIETVFNWQGLGWYSALSIMSLDYPSVMGITIVVASVYVFLNLIVDVTLAYLDPRIRLGR